MLLYHLKQHKAIVICINWSPVCYTVQQNKAQGILSTFADAFPEQGAESPPPQSSGAGTYGMLHSALDTSLPER